MHRILLTCHRWVALVATILILVVAITGSALVFEGAMDRAMHPELWHVSPGPARVSIDTMIARAHVAVAGPPVTGVNFSPGPDRADVIQAGINQVFVNPYTGAVIGRRTAADWNKTLPRRLHVLHVSLMSGKAGGEIVGAVTVLSFFLVITGVFLWWRDKLWRVRWGASWKRVIFDLHHTLGVIAALVIAVITASGMVIHYRTLSAWMYGLDGTPAPAVPDQPAAPPGTASISADSLYRVATAALPGARVMFVTLPPKGDQVFGVAMRFPEDHTPGGRSRVYVDRYSGAVLLATSTREAQIGTRLGNAIRSIHTGDLFGKPTEMLWLAAAIILATQGITGVSMWWNGRPARAALARAARSQG